MLCGERAPLSILNQSMSSKSASLSPSAIAAIAAGDVAKVQSMVEAGHVDVNHKDKARLSCSSMHSYQ